MAAVWQSCMAVAVIAGVAACADIASNNGEQTGYQDASASIPFAGYQGRIRDWQDLGREAILIQEDTGDWYRAEFMGSCHNLPFAQTIGFVIDGSGEIDRFSSILVRGAGGTVEECWFSSFKQAPAPAE